MNYNRVIEILRRDGQPYKTPRWLCLGPGLYGGYAWSDDQDYAMRFSDTEAAENVKHFIAYKIKTRVVPIQEHDGRVKE